MGWHFVPDDWEMSAYNVKWTRDKGVCGAELEEALRSFRDHQYQRPMKDADRCWRNWVVFGIKKGIIVPVQNPTYRKPKELTDDERQADIIRFEEHMKKLGVK